MQEKRSENVMTRLSRFIVDKRKAFFMVFLVASVFCVGSIDKVEVNDDITSYLPAETETRRGLDLMEQEFITLASADVMVDNYIPAGGGALGEAGGYSGRLRGGF